MKKEYKLQDILHYVGVRGAEPQMQGWVETLMQTQDTRIYRNMQEKITARMYQDEVKTPTQSEQNIILKYGQMPTLTLESPVVSVQKTKKIVTTSMVQYDGTVKELISDGDWQIQIRGIFCNQNLEKPLSELKNALKIWQIKDTIEVFSAYLNTFGIQSLVITDLRFPDTPYINILPYEISALSDKPFEMKRKDKL